MSPDEKYDVFMCCRLTDENNFTTPDREYADEIYDQLTIEGVNVYYAPVTEANEETAIAEAKVYLVIASDEESFYAEPFRSEWGRCTAEARRNSEKSVITCVKGIGTQQIPQELLDNMVRDISRIDFLTELIRSVKKLTESSDEVGISTPPEKLLRRIEDFLQAEDFEAAAEYCRLIKEASPQNWQAYYYLFLADRGLRGENDLFLDEVIDGFACEYAERYGADVSDDDYFRSTFAEILGNDMRRALEYSSGEDRVRLATLYERFVSAVQDAVFAIEQNEIDGEEKKELEKLRIKHQHEQSERAAVKLKKQQIRTRLLTYTAVILVCLAVLAIKFGFKWAIALIVVVAVITVICIAGLEQ
ncbi:hypothetical protein SAMN02910265_01948 [Ruminococcus flavefaciens]|uniref:TIR domain-containing protein n=1 Tax=Ruminococcus flavefaciens TaxID=1265 RepID=A0A1H6JRR4_RUMFL|nr:hypothetical protein [Ruminococcus flavefaciens]SEH65204.1 hypothetical protein SAMN02910265_01948 [Ruminococcus flavefaciens]